MWRGRNLKCALACCCDELVVSSCVCVGGGAVGEGAGVEASYLPSWRYEDPKRRHLSDIQVSRRCPCELTLAQSRGEKCLQEPLPHQP